MSFKQADVTGSLVTIRFEYDRNLIDKIRTLPQRNWNPKQKIWTAPAIPIVIDQLIKWGFDVSGAECSTFLKKEGPPKWLDIPVSKIDGLRPYQVDCLKFLEHRRGRGGVGDEMGTGKTIESLSYIRENWEARLPALLLVTAQIKLQWLREWRKWIGPYPATVLNGQIPYILPKNTSVIINWDILTYWKDALKERKFKVMIADECQFAGNSSSKRTQAMTALAKDIPGFIPMSGTPIRTRPGQFFPILHLLEPSVFPSEWKFKKRYCNMTFNGYGWDEKRGGRNLEELHTIVSSCFIRREKKDIMPDLPDKIRSVIPMETGGAQLQEYEDAERKVRNNLDGLSRFEVQSQIDSLKWSAFKSKQDAVVRWIKDFLESEPDKKLVVYAYHLAVLKFLDEFFKDISLKIDGTVTGNRRESVKQEFINNPKKRLLVGQILALGVGVDGLQNVCQDCAFVEFAWTPLDHDQAEDRLHRDNQKGDVNSRFLTAVGTIDDDLMTVLDETRGVFDQVVRGQESSSSDMLTCLLTKWR